MTGFVTVSGFGKPDGDGQNFSAGGLAQGSLIIPWPLRETFEAPLVKHFSSLKCTKQNLTRAGGHVAC